MSNEIILLKDVIIPAGTIFECIDGRISTYSNGNYEATLSTGNDSPVNTDSSKVR